MADEKIISFPHNLSLEERKKLTVSGVTDIVSFDEQTIVSETELGELTIKGEQLHIVRMSVDTGELTVEGEIVALMYSEIQQTSGSFFSRLFK